jgi:hypothetical protein
VIHCSLAGGSPRGERGPQASPGSTAV